MKLRILVTFLGVSALLLLASATLAQPPEPLESRPQHIPTAPEARGRLQEPEPEAFGATDRPERLAERPVERPPPPLMQGRRAAEPPEPPPPASERLPADRAFALPEEPPPPLQPSAPDLFLLSEQPFLPGMAPHPVPRLSRGEMGILAATPAITVVETYDYVWGYHANTDDTLLLRLYDGATLKGFGVARTDGMGYFYGEFFDQGSQVDIDPGDTVEVGTGVATDTIELVQITGSADPLNDQVTGVITGTGLSLPVSVTVAIPWAGINQTVSTDGMGNFTVDFTGIYDMDAYDPGDVGYEDGAGNWVSTQLSPVGFCTVHDTPNNVDGYAAPEASVTITRTPALGSPESNTTTASETDGRFSVSFSAIEPDDVIEVDNGTTVISTTVVTLTGTSAPWATDIISGTAPADSDVAVAVSQISPAGGWHKKTVTSAGSGDYAADFSGIVDLDRWSTIYVISPDANGNETWIQFSPPLASVNETYNNVWGLATPGALVSATLKDSGGSTKETGTDTSRPASGYYEIGFDADVETGDRVEVTGGGISATIVVTTLSALADTDADTISGLSPASSDLIVQGWRWDYIAGPRFDEFVTSFGGGTYTDDLSGRYDLYNGYEGDVYYSQPDEHKLYVHYHAPGLHVNQTHDGVWGYVDTPNIPVTFTLRTAGDVQMDQTVITSEQTDGYIEAWFDGSVDIVPGDKVEVETASWTNLVTVTALSLDVDVDTDILSGTGPPNTIVNVTVHERNYAFLGEMSVPTDDSGNFSADFTDQELDITGNETLSLGCENEDHNENYLWRIAHYLRVNQTHDWIQGVGTPNATLSLTVTRDSTTFTGSTTADGGGWFDIDGWDLSPQVDLQVGDVVHMTSDGVSRTLTVMAMTAVPNIDTDSISGNVAGGGDGDPVRIEISAEGADSVDTTTNGSGNYSTALGGWDLKAGHQLVVWYITGDGDECGIVVAYLQIRAEVSENWIDGGTKPSATVNVTLTGSGIKGTATTASNEEGYYATEVHTDTTVVDIASGDTIEVTADGRQASVEALLTVQVDGEANTISGSAPANTDVVIDIWWYGWFYVQSDEYGDYTFHGDDEGITLQPGMQGRVRYWTEEGHEVMARFGVPFLRVNQTYEFMEGIAKPNTTVDISVTRGTSTFTDHTTADGDGWFYINAWWDFTPQVDLQPGDVVHMTSDGISRTLTIVAMTGVPNIDTDSTSGNVSGTSDGDAVRIDIWADGAGSVDTTTNSSGNYSTGLGDWDLKAGHELAVWYITDDGDECGIVVAYLQIRAYLTWDWIDGQTKPDATVNVNLIDGGIKGTASTSSDESGWYGTNVYTGTTNVDIVSGDTIEVTVDGRQASLHAILTVEVDADLDTISGEAPPNTQIQLDIWDHGGFYLQSDGSGYYSFDTDEEGIDLEPGMEGRVRYWTSEGHQVGARWGVPFLRVNQTYDFMEGFAKPNTTVDIIVTRGASTFLGSTTADGSGWFYTNAWWDFTPQVDIQPGDFVEMTSDGVYRSLAVVAMSGTPDIDADTISGNVAGASDGELVRIDIWAEGADSVDTTTNSSGNYSTGLGDWDLKAGHEAAVWYITDDGDECGIVVAYLHIGAYLTSDWIDGLTKPDATVNVNLIDGGIKGIATTSSDESGWYGTNVYTDTSTEVDIVSGDTVEVTVDGRQASLDAILTVEVDADADTISGSAPPNTDLQLDIWDHGRFNLQSDGLGNYSFDAPGAGIDLQAGMEGRVRYWTDEGHQVEASFEVPYARVNYGWDWVQGRVGIFAMVHVTVTGVSGDKGYNSTEAGSDGWFDLEAGADVVPGDTVRVTSPSGLDATLEVITITGEVDVSADTVHGTMYGGVFPAKGFVDVWRPPDWDPYEWMSIDIDEFGNYEADFSGRFDIQLGDHVAVWYIQPDGHHIGVAFDAEAAYSVYVPLVMKNFHGYVPVWTNIVTEDFEGTFPSGSWSVGGDTPAGEVYWGADDFKPYQGDWSAWPASAGPYGVDPQYSNYPNDLLSWMSYGPFSLSDALDAEVLFYFWNRSQLDYDLLYWGASVDDSLYYGENVTGDSGGWQFRNFDLTDVYFLGDLTGEPEVWLVFVFWSDELITDKGAFLDNIILRKQIMVPGGTAQVAEQRLSSELPKALTVDTGVAFYIDHETGRPVTSPTPTSTLVLSPTATLVPTPTEVPTATPTATAVPTSTEVVTPTATLTPTPTDTATAVSTATGTPTATNEPTSTPTATPTSTSTATPTGTPTEALPPAPEPCPTPEES